MAMEIHNKIKHQIEEIKIMLSKNDLELALTNFRILLREYENENIYNKFIMVSARNKRILEERKLGIAHTTDASLEENKVLEAILFLLNEFERAIISKDIDLNSEDINSQNIDNFKKWKARFVHLEAKELKAEINLYAEEIYLEKRKFNQSNRKGEIVEIVRKLLSQNEKLMLLVGKAGMGKSTTLQYLTYSFTLSNEAIVFFAELKLYEGESVLKLLESIYNLNATSLSEYLKEKRIVIFLDGFNEINQHHISKFIKELKKFTSQFPEIFLLLSSRYNDKLNVFNCKNVFVVKNMTSSQIKEFINKNSIDNNVNKIIGSKVITNRRWRDVLSVPLYLYMFINLVTFLKIIPNDETKIIDLFLKNIVRRELEKDLNFDADLFINFLSSLAYFTLYHGVRTNSGVTTNHIVDLITNKSKSIDEVDTFYVLRKAIQLNLITNDGDKYSFTHQVFQEVLAGYYLNALRFKNGEN